MISRVKEVERAINAAIMLLQSTSASQDEIEATIVRLMKARKILKEIESKCKS